MWRIPAAFVRGVSLCALEFEEPIVKDARQ
jgi:hypothetical protein